MASFKPVEPLVQDQMAVQLMASLIKECALSKVKTLYQTVDLPLHLEA